MPKMVPEHLPAVVAIEYGQFIMSLKTICRSRWMDIALALIHLAFMAFLAISAILVRHFTFAAIVGTLLVSLAAGHFYKATWATTASLFLFLFANFLAIFICFPVFDAAAPGITPQRLLVFFLVTLICISLCVVMYLRQWDGRTSKTD
jgi:hypothetical protein